MNRSPIDIRRNYWGAETVSHWAVGETGRRPLCELQAPPESKTDQPRGLWRVSVAIQSGALPAGVLSLIARASAGGVSVHLSGILTPAVFYAPGPFDLDAELGSAQLSDVTLSCRITPVNGAGRSAIHTRHVAGEALPPTALRVVSLDAATVVTIAGAPVALPVGAGVPVAYQSVVAAGVVMAEHEL